MGGTENCHNHRPSHSTARKRHIALTATRQQNTTKGAEGLTSSKGAWEAQDNVTEIGTGKCHNHRLSNGTARKRHITQPHDSKTQLEDLKGLPDPKGQERYRKMPQSQTKPRHREEETYNTTTRLQNTTRGPERLT